MHIFFSTFVPYAGETDGWDGFFRPERVAKLQGVFIRTVHTAIFWNGTAILVERNYAVELVFISPRKVFHGCERV